jgi:hypothetical protein
MAMPNPNRDELRAILTAAADVIFSDGVSEAFLDRWVDETLCLLSNDEREVIRSATQ